MKKTCQCDMRITSFFITRCFDPPSTECLLELIGTSFQRYYIASSLLHQRNHVSSGSQIVAVSLFVSRPKTTSVKNEEAQTHLCIICHISALVANPTYFRQINTSIDERANFSKSSRPMQEPGIIPSDKSAGAFRTQGFSSFSSTARGSFY